LHRLLQIQCGQNSVTNYKKCHVADLLSAVHAMKPFILNLAAKSKDPDSGPIMGGVMMDISGINILNFSFLKTQNMYGN
jgi:hypothetical protein